MKSHIRHTGILRALILLAALIFLVAHLSYADNQTDKILHLLQGDRLAEALIEADELVTSYPDRPDYLFIKATVLDRLGNPEDAVAIYKQLIDQFPEFPEPYNNLALHQANNGDYPKAIETLEKAFHTNDSYSVAYQNLQSIYDRMANEAYREALRAISGFPSLSITASLKSDLFFP